METTNISEKPCALVHARIFDGSKMLEEDCVLISQGLIQEVGNSAELAQKAQEVVEADGGFLMPGLIDTHVHIKSPDQLSNAASFGVTTMVDMGTDVVELKATLAQNPHAAQIPVFSGWAGGPTKGLHAFLLHVPKLTSVEDAKQQVLDRIALGVGFIKVIVDSRSLFGTVFVKKEVLTALAEASHQQGFKLVGHVSSNAAFQLAIDCGLDIVTHVPFSEVLTDDLAQALQQKNMITIPTLHIAEAMTEGMPWLLRKLMRKSDYGKAKQSFQALLRAGLPIIAGTDATGDIGGMPFKTKHGEAMHRELELMVQAGLSPSDALCAATSKAAQLFEMHDRGKIAPGCRADLVLVQGNPLEDISATRNIQGVWIGGKRWQQ